MPSQAHPLFQTCVRIHNLWLATSVGFLVLYLRRAQKRKHPVTQWMFPPQYTNFHSVVPSATGCFLPNLIPVLKSCRNRVGAKVLCRIRVVFSLLVNTHNEVQFHRPSPLSLVLTLSTDRSIDTYPFESSISTTEETSTVVRVGGTRLHLGLDLALEETSTGCSTTTTTTPPDRSVFEALQSYRGNIHCLSRLLL